MPLVMPRLLMPLSLRYTSVVSLFGLLSVLNTCRHYLKQSWEGYQKFSGKNPAYHREMEINYPKFQDILDYLSRQSISGNVVRMNRHGGDDTVWYFAEASDCFYIMQLSDSM